MLLKSGNSGEEVSNLQRLLKLAGFDPGPIDGIFGSKTGAALIALQEAAGLEADGIYGPKSAEALKGWKMGAGAGEPDEPEPPIPDGPMAI